MIGQLLAVTLRSVLAADASSFRAAGSNRDVQRGQCQSRFNRSAQRIADDPARPGVKDHREINEAGGNGDVCYVGDPEPIWAIRRHVLC